jgi:hypothetical protein
MRSTPALYVIDSKGQIAAKNITVVQAMQLAADEANRSEK